MGRWAPVGVGVTASVDAAGRTAVARYFARFASSMILLTVASSAFGGWSSARRGLAHGVLPGSRRRDDPRGKVPGDQSPASDALTPRPVPRPVERSEEHTSELQSLMRISYAVFCLKKKKQK